MLTRLQSGSGSTFLQPSISSCCPTRKYGLDVDSHWSIHAVPPSNYAEAQTLRASCNPVKKKKEHLFHLCVFIFVYVFIECQIYILFMEKKC